MPEKIGVQAVFEDAQFKKGVADYNKGLADAEKSTEGFADAGENATKGLDEVDQGMLKAGRGAIDLAAKMIIVERVFNDVKQLAQQGLELAKVGATAERVEQRFGKLAESAGGADEILRAFQEGAGGAASKMDAMLSSSKLLQMGLVDDAESMEEVVEMASRLGDQTMTVGDRVQDFALMLANQSIPRLDNFGISSGKVRARIIELQDAVEGMTREQAFMQATMEAGGDSLIRLGDRVEDNAMAFEKMEAKMADARVELGQKFAGVAADAIGIFGSLGDEAMLVFAAFGEFGGALIRLGPLLGGVIPLLSPKLLNAIKGAAGQMSLMTGLMTAGLLVAIPVLIKLIGDLGKKMEAIEKKSKEAVAAADDWSEAIAEQIDSGREAADVFEEYGKKADEAADAWNKNVVTSTVLGELFLSHSKILKIIQESQTEATQAVMEAAGSYEEAAKWIKIYNDQVEDASWQIDDFTKAQYDLWRASLDNQAAAENVSQATWDAMESFYAGEAAAIDWETSLGYLTDEMKDQADAVDSSDRAMLAYTQSWMDGTIVFDDAEAAQANLVYTIGEQKKAYEDGLKAAEDAKKKTEELAKANEIARKAADNHRLAMLGLAEQLSKLEEPADIALLALDLLQKQYELGTISGPEFARVTEELKLELGLLTPEGLAAADATEALAIAAGKGLIPIDKMDEAILELSGQVANGALDMQGLLDKYSTVPLFFDPATGAIRTFNIATGEGGQPLSEMRKEALLLHDGIIKLPGSAIPAADALKGLGEKAGGITEPVTGAWEASVKLGDATARIPEVADSAATSIGGYGSKASAAIEPVDVLADDTLKLDKSASPIPGKVDPASTSVAGFGTASRDAIAPVQDLKGEILTVPDVADEAANRMAPAGAAIFANLQAGAETKAPGFIAYIRRIFGIIADMLPWSEPADTSSPLYGLSSAGEAIVNNILDGINLAKMGWKDTLDTLFGYAGAFGGIAGAAAAPLRKQTTALAASIREIEKQSREIDKARQVIFKGIGEDIGFYGGDIESSDAARRALMKIMGGQAGYKDILGREATSGITSEERALLTMMRELTKLDAQRAGFAGELATKGKEYAEQQERLLRLQEKQEQLRFLEAQFKLMDMLREAGLPIRETLKGLKLGIDADMEAIVDAMVEAMEELIRQANEKLEIGSPSAVFQRMGQDVMQGMALGIEEMAGLPMRASLIATGNTVSMPARMMAGGMGNVDNSRAITVQAGGNTISSGMDEAMFEARVTRAVSRALRGERR